ncbi:MAG: hypothetical protein GX590_06775 [Lentisphaerae bacterium]|nr:hypothetical protein [Lentisphaerota bacterium]
MRINLKILAICPLLGSLAFVQVGLAEPAAVEPPPELDCLVQRYARDLDAIEVASSNRQFSVLDSYRGSVGALEREERRVGNLDGVLACRNEQDHFARQGRLPTNVSEHVSLGNLQRSFGEKWRSLDRERLMRRSMLARQYLLELDQLKRELVRGGQTDATKAVQLEIDRVRKRLEPPRPPSPPSRPRSIFQARPRAVVAKQDMVVWDFTAGQLPEDARQTGPGRFACSRDGLLAVDYGVSKEAYFGPELHLPVAHTGDFRLTAAVLYASLEGIEAGYLQLVVRFADGTELYNRVMDHNDQVPEVVEMVGCRGRVITRKPPRFGRAEWRGREVVIERKGLSATVLSGGELLATVPDVSTNRLTEIAIVAHRIVGRSQPLVRVGLRSLTLSRPEQEHQDWSR